MNIVLGLPPDIGCADMRNDVRGILSVVVDPLLFDYHSEIVEQVAKIQSRYFHPASKDSRRVEANPGSISITASL